MNRSKNKIWIKNHQHLCGFTFLRKNHIFDITGITLNHFRDRFHAVCRELRNGIQVVNNQTDKPTVSPGYDDLRIQFARYVIFAEQVMLYNLMGITSKFVFLLKVKNHISTV